MNYADAKEIRVQRVRSGSLTDKEQRVLGVVLRAPDGLHVTEVVRRSLEPPKTVEHILNTLHQARLVAQNGRRGQMARWCKPGREQHCRDVAHAKFYAERASTPADDENRKEERRKARREQVNREYKARAKFSRNLPDEPVRIIGPAREFTVPGPISVFHLGQQ